MTFFAREQDGGRGTVLVGSQFVAAVSSSGRSTSMTSLSHLAFLPLFDGTEDVWREEELGLVKQQSVVARWSRPDEFERILLAA